MSVGDVFFSASRSARTPRPHHLAVVPLVLCLSGCADIGWNPEPGAESIFQAFSPPSPRQAAEWAIDRYDPDKRHRGTLLLAAAPFASEPVYVELFVRNIEDTDPRVRAAAARALGNNGEPEHLPLLITALADDDPLVRQEAAVSLQRIHGPEAIDPLRERIAVEVTRSGDRVNVESEAIVRAEAAHALGQYPSREVVYDLIRALRENPLSVNVATRSSLRTLTGQDFGYDYNAWREWFEGNTDPFAARAAYYYPVYRRDKRFLEYIPFVPQPPNEARATPVGMPPIGAE
jgi:hypothetical protein